MTQKDYHLHKNYGFVSSSQDIKDLKESDVIYDWNSAYRKNPITSQKVEFVDETLRDGIQSPSVKDPSIDEKVKILHLMNSIGVTTANLGLPGAGLRAQQDVTRLCKEISDYHLNIQANCASRTHAYDIIPIIEISQKTGVPIEVTSFLGSSPIRAYAEDWDISRLQKHVAESMDLIVKAGLKASFVTEDTTRSHPQTLDILFRTAINHGASRLVLCDTVGHATPDGLFNLIRFAKSIIDTTSENVQIDWHGHNDRGLSLTLCLHAIEWGVNRVHGTCMGIGERVGNAPLDLILLNLKLLGVIQNNLTSLQEYVATVSKATNFPIPVNYPLFGKDAFRTATGVHAAAIIKAKKREH